MTRWKTFFILVFLMAALLLLGGSSAFCFSQNPVTPFFPQPKNSFKIYAGVQFSKSKKVSEAIVRPLPLDAWLRAHEAFARAA